MAFNFSVCKVGDDSYRVSGSTGQGSSRSTTQNFTQAYIVQTLDADGSRYSGNPSDINTAIVGRADGLPLVQRSIYYDSDSGVVHPYAICISKDVKRRKDAPTIFDVTCTFQAKTETESEHNEIPNDPTDLRPEVTVSVDGKERVLYQDLETKKQAWLFEGINLQYPAPVTTQVPLLTLTISQYETYVSYAQILARSYKVNSSAWQGFDAGFWRMVVKNVSEVEIQTVAGLQTWAKVTYEAKLSQDGFYDENGVWTPTGWKAQIPLIAPKYVAGVPYLPGTVLKFVNTQTSEPYMGLINQNGTEYTGTRPKFLTHTRHNEIDFNTFMRPF